MFKVVSETPSILPYDSVQTRIDLPLTRQEAILHLMIKSSLLNKRSYLTLGSLKWWMGAGKDDKRESG